MADQDTELRPSWWNYWLSLLFAVASLVGALVSLGTDHPLIGGVVGLVLALIFLLVAAIKRFMWKFVVSHDSVAQHHGIVARTQQSVRMSHIRSVKIIQGLAQRIFGVGNLEFYSAGSDTAEVQFVGIPDPSYWKDEVEKRVEQSTPSQG